MTLGVVEVDTLMDLPQVQVIGPQTPQRLLELAHGDRRVAAVRADFRHQEDRVPPIGDGASHPALTLPFVVLPGVVEEVDPGIDRFMNDSHGFGNGPGLAKVIASETDDRNLVG